MCICCPIAWARCWIPPCMVHIPFVEHPACFSSLFWAIGYWLVWCGHVDIRCKAFRADRSNRHLDVLSLDIVKSANLEGPDTSFICSILTLSVLVVKFLWIAQHHFEVTTGEPETSHVKQKWWKLLRTQDLKWTTSPKVPWQKSGMFLKSSVPSARLQQLNKIDANCLPCFFKHKTLKRNI